MLDQYDVERQGSRRACINLCNAHCLCLYYAASSNSSKSMVVTDVHALGEEAIAVVRQAVSLATGRGHAQVTPLHIANAILSAKASAPAGILRAACVRSQSHPLQHNLLDLCLDLALGRLAVTAEARHGGDPVPSNAFVAALKRAQGHPHRRTGGAGGMLQLGKLIVSVLDDPSVDRVMRAAGFSSSQVRASVVASLEQSSRAGCDVAVTSPNPAGAGARARGGQPSPQTVPGGSECQTSKGKSGAGRPATFGGTKLDAATSASIPPWFLLYRDTSTAYCGTSLQADAACRRPKFTELTATNLKIMCDALELRAPWHRSIVPGISSTVLRCRSGVARRRTSSSSSLTAATWLLFLGSDVGGMMAVARELARLVFGSYAEFTALQVQCDTDIPARSGKLDLKRQRSRDNGDGGDVGARLFEAVAENPHRVMLIDGVDRLDRDSEMRFKNAMAGGGMVRGCNGDVVGLEDAIVVLSASGLLDSRYVDSSSSPRVKRRLNEQNRDEGDAAEMEGRSRLRHSWDLNACAMDGEGELEDGLVGDEGIMDAVGGIFLFNQ
ncbi:hypothetical protein D1007_17670 [Hordeum vulgare]|nr:hypothetical protein D1007_17670 [Hordeum vulgare]